MNHRIKMSLLNKRWNIEYKMTIAELKFESLNKIWVYWTKNWHIEYRMTITEQKYELLNINCMLLNIATIRQPYKWSPIEILIIIAHTPYACEMSGY